MGQVGACYIRVSTEDQAEYSPDAQRRAILAYAARNDIALPGEHIYIDEGASGKRADKRPRFQAMIAAARKKPRPFDVILVHRLDRFARSREDSVVYKSLLKKEAGIRVVSVTEPIEDDKLSVILEAMLEAMAEYYSLNLADEVKKGMREKAERGGLQTAAAFGYRAVGNRLEPEEAEARYVRLLFAQYAAGEQSLRRLAARLGELGAATRRGNPFDRRAVEYILRNPVYIGKLRWTPSGRVRRDFHNPDTIVRDGGHPPLVDREVWTLVQRRLEQNRKLYHPRQKADPAPFSWLRGIAFCGNCGRALVRSKGVYFQCNGYNKGRCAVSCNVRADLLEALALEELRCVFPMPLHIVPPRPVDSAGEIVPLLERQLVELDARARRIREAYQGGVDTLEEYRRGKAELTAARESVTAQLEGLREALPAGRSEAFYWGSVGDLLADPAADPLLKNRAARFLLQKAVYTKQRRELRILLRGELPD